MKLYYLNTVLYESQKQSDLLFIEKCDAFISTFDSVCLCDITFINMSIKFLKSQNVTV